MWVHKRGLILNFVILCIYVLYKLYLIIMYMHKGPLKNMQHLYLYGSVIRLYEIGIWY